MSITKKKRNVPLRTLNFLELLNEYTITVRQAWEWRAKNPQSHAGRSSLYQRELKIKKELLNRGYKIPSSKKAKVPRERPTWWC